MFDITRSGVPNRMKPPGDVPHDQWLYKRNTQCNYDTLMQAISIRSQPETQGQPRVEDARNYAEFWGLSHRQNSGNCWVFEFAVQHSSVFHSYGQELGALLWDCNDIPMILCGTEITSLRGILCTNGPDKNVHFEVLQ